MKTTKLMLCAVPLAVLMGCVGAPGSPVPATARLSADQVTVGLSDGSQCRAPIGAGRMEGCGSGFEYRVELVENPNLLRRLVQGAFAALGTDGTLAPMGQVTLTDDAGRMYRFVSPVPVPDGSARN
ncbi:hypothetical protein [Pseudorhodobacter ferrugineus]|uniref:hypothetical protein n=1 Tax=Pseudorhodobacter ferrugineus TaxID=77008 RepID=UPI000AAEB202|nr:hypothetical protein [Pseudorhodobacter ferrugineus]